MTTGRLPWCLARERRHGSSSWCHRGVTSPERRDDEVVVDVDARGVAHGLARGVQFGDVLRAQRERVLTRLVGRPEREGLPGSSIISMWLPRTWATSCSSANRASRAALRR